MTLTLTPEERQYIKELCLMFNGQYVIVDGVRFVVPLDKWKYEGMK